MRLNAAGHSSEHLVWVFPYLRNKGMPASNGGISERVWHARCLPAARRRRSHALRVHILQIIRGSIGRLTHYAGFESEIRKNASIYTHERETIPQGRRRRSCCDKIGKKPMAIV